MLEIIKTIWSNEKYRQVFLPVAGMAVGVALTVLFYPTKQIKEEAVKEFRHAVEQEVAAEFYKKEEQLRETFSKEVNNLTSQLERSIQDQSYLQKRISSLSTENTKLKKKRRVETIKIKKPDGTEETHIVDITDTESISSKHERQISELNETHKKKLEEVESKYEEKIVAEQTKFKSKIDEVSKELTKSKEKIEELEKKNKVVTTNSRNFGVGVGYTTDKNYSGEVSYQFWGPAYIQISGDSDFESEYLGRATLGIRF